MDIDTSNPSSFSSSISSTDVHRIKQQVKDGKDSIKFDDPPDEKSYKFQDFVAVQDIDRKQNLWEDEDEENVSEKSFLHPAVSISGQHNSDEAPDYHGPAFPPQSLQNDNLLKNIHTSPSLQQRAHKWLEQELLARMISQMEGETADPTLKEVADNVSVCSVKTSDSRSSEDWVDNIIGLQGIQLFIDAGIPVNKDIVCQLIRSVILERLETLFGYPPPSRHEKEPTEITGADEVDIKTVISTPTQTPLPSLVSEKHIEVRTPDHTISDLQEQSINDSVRSEPLPAQKYSYALVETPQPSISEPSKRSLLDHQVATPDLSQDTDVDGSTDVDTPELTESKNISYVKQDDFIVTDLSSPETDDGRFAKEDLEKTPNVDVTRPVFIATTSPSTPSTSFTICSSSTVGVSTFEGISMGEHLHPSQVMSEDHGSLGELGLPGLIIDVKSGGELEEEIFQYDQDTQGTQIKLMLKDILNTHRGGTIQRGYLESTLLNTADMKSEGEVSQAVFKPLKSLGEITSIEEEDEKTVKQTEDIDEDTLEEISEEKNLKHTPVDPMTKLLRKINSPVSGKQKTRRSDKSQGEIIFSRSENEKLNVLNERNDNTTTSTENNSKDLLSLGQLVTRDSDRMSPLDDKVSPEGGLSANQVNVPRIITVQTANNNDEDKSHKFFKGEGEIISFDSSPRVEEEEDEGTEGSGSEKVVMVLKIT